MVRNMYSESYLYFRSDNNTRQLSLRCLSVRHNLHLKKKKRSSGSSSAPCSCVLLALSVFLEELISRLIVLTKAQGDAIDEKVGVIAGLFVETDATRKVCFHLL